MELLGGWGDGDRLSYALCGWVNFWAVTRMLWSEGIMAARLKTLSRFILLEIF
jgi:hypothetical protein